MHFSGLTVALATSLAAASPISEPQASCPTWDPPALVEVENHLGCCVYADGPAACVS